MKNFAFIALALGIGFGPAAQAEETVIPYYKVKNVSLDVAARGGAADGHAARNGALDRLLHLCALPLLQVHPLVAASEP